MTKKIIIIIQFLTIGIISVNAQSYTISGSLTDDTNGEDLIGVTIVEDGTYTGTTTNAYGFYSLTLKEGKRKIKFSYMGFESYYYDIDLTSDKTLDIKLKPTITQLEAVTITAKRDNDNIRSSQMSVAKMEVKDLEKVPVLMGEKDILKSIQLLPGISTVSEGSSGFSVRGGSIDQNLILLDEAPLYSASHLMGFFSVFNSDALKNVSVYKGGIPANYGGRVSSVLDISIKEGNNQKFSGLGGIGLISSRFTFEGPIIQDKMSFIVSARRSYMDLAAKSIGLMKNSMDLFFYDINAKINYKINDNNRIFLSGYFGKDVFGFEDMGMKWGNTTATVRWNHLFSNKLFSNTTFIYSNYDYGFNLMEDTEMNSGIEDLGLKQDYSWFLNPNNTLKFGFNITKHVFEPGELLSGENESYDIVLDQTNAIESGIYISNKQKIGGRFSTEYGLRISMYNQIGEGWANTYNDNNVKTDSIYYGKDEVMETYWDIEPRLSLSYMLNESSSVKASYNRMAQYVHLLSNSTSGQPTDTWMSSSNNVKPKSVSQFALGYFKNFKNNEYEFSVETYYKLIDNATDYKDGTSVLLNEDVESYILCGEGRSYGLEFYLKKKYGRFNGWISYTLSHSENKFDKINNGDWYNTKYDKTHDVSIVLNYELSKRLSISAAWVYYTGNAVTFPSGQYQYDNQSWSYYTERNGYRMPDNHRLDLNLHLDGKKDKKFQTSWDFSLYNAYDRLNAYTITFQESETIQGANEAVKLSLFGIVPSVSWNFKF